MITSRSHHAGAGLSDRSTTRPEGRGRLTGTDASVHVSVVIAAPADAVYRWARDPAYLSRWVGGLASSPVEEVDGVLVVAHPGGAEVVFTVRQRAGMSAADLDRDVAAVHADLETLRGHAGATGRVNDRAGRPG